MRRNRLFALLFACVALMFVVAAGCGGDDDDGGGGPAATGEGGKQTEGAKVIDPASLDSAKGDITYCVGKDTTGFLKTSQADFAKAYPDITLKVVEFPPSADEQRNQFIQRQQAKSGDCDIFSSDVIWTAEFASQKWLYDVTPWLEAKKADFLEAPLAAITFEDKYWGVPESSDAAFLYVRNDLNVEQPLETWQQVYEQAKANGGIVFQGAPYEGLTCDFLELAYAAGGEVLSEDGTKSVIDSPENLEALELMTEAVQGGAAPKAVTTYMEPESVTAWQTGDYAIMRNWTYAYSVSQKESPKVANKFDVVTFPSFGEGGGKAAILGGHSAVISAFSENPGAALAYLEFTSSPEHQKKIATDASLAPALIATYDDADVKKALPYAADLKTTIEQARTRPVSPVYPQISQAIYKNVNAAISGQMEPKAALEQAQKDIEGALATF